MPAVCSICGCTSGKRKDEVVSFHRFPLSKPILLKAWLDNIQREEFIPRIHSKICSYHFSADSFVTAGYHNRRFLKEGAIPTFFDFFKCQTYRPRKYSDTVAGKCNTCSENFSSEEISVMNFERQKKINLQKIDLSKKGSIDDRISDLVDFINNMDNYVTTSSCSGRTIIFMNSDQKKIGCKWLFTSHDDTVESQNVIDALYKHLGSAVLKFEPFIMHVRCASLKSAQKLHTCCLESGFRNSGLTMGKKGGIVLAIRSTLTVEVPLSCYGKLLVTSAYIAYVVNICNEKMRENWNRTKVLFEQIKNLDNQTNQTALNENDEDVVYPIEISQIKQECIEIEEEDNTNSWDEFFDGFENLITCSENIPS